MNMAGGRVVCWVFCLFWALLKLVLWCFGCGSVANRKHLSWSLA